MPMGRNSEWKNKLSETQLLAGMLRDAREHRRTVSVHQLRWAGIAHVSARVSELRRRGFVVENDTWTDWVGQKCSQYWLTHDPELDARSLTSRIDLSSFGAVKRSGEPNFTWFRPRLPLQYQKKSGSSL